MAANQPRAPVLLPSAFSTQTLDVKGLRMHMAVEGPEGAPLVLLLHGFPEFWYSWRFQIKALAAAGYRVVAPDQRGYNLTEKRGPFDINTLSDDVAALIAVLGYEKAAAVIGHDWGGVVTWVFGARFSEKVTKLVVCNVPHLRTMQDVMRAFYLEQLRKSWYMFFFQLPRLPERSLMREDFRVLAAGLKRDLKGTISPEEMAAFKEGWGQPGALHNGINWYRALFRHPGLIRKQDLTVRVPSLLIWGDQDAFLSVRTAEWTRKYVLDLRVEYLHGISHWVQQQAPDQVNQLILDFLGAPSAKG